MIRGALFVFALSLTPAAALAAGCEDVEANPDWDAAFHYAARLVEDRLVVDFEVAPCFHAYGPKTETGEPLELRLLDEGVSAAGPARYPKGVREQGPFGPRVVIRGKGRIVLPLEHLDEAPDAVKAKLRYHVCTDNACGRPRQVDLRVPVT